MSFRSEMEKIETAGAMALEKVGFARNIFMGFMGIAILAGIIYLQVKFNAIKQILDSIFAAEQFKDPSMWWGYLFPFVFFGVWILGAFYMICNMIVTIISVKNPYGKSAITLAYIKSISVAIPFTLAGTMFFLAGIFICISFLIKGEYASIGGGLICGLMGLVSLAVGVFQIISNTSAYKDYLSTGGVSFAPSRSTLLLKFASDNVPLLLTGIVFTLVPILLVGFTITSPGMDELGVLMMMIMCFAFGGIGVYAIVFSIKKFKEANDGFDISTNEEDYHDLSLK